MFKEGLALSLIGGALIISGCATRPVEDPLDEFDPPAAGVGGSEVIIDNTDAMFFTEGPWVESSASSGYYGDNYHVIPSGAGQYSAVWNLETITDYDIYARWSSHSNRASNAEYLIHYIDESGSSAIDTVTVNQRSNGGEWVKLGTYRMSSLTGRVELTDAANGYVIADAIRFVPVAAKVMSDSDGDGVSDAFERQYGMDPDNPEDALNDLDGDGLTNLEEFYQSTNPTVSDTDGDGIDDAYEVSYGLNPLAGDASADADNDGATNLEEFTAGTEANDATSIPGTGPLITWSAPTQRIDGSELSESDIDRYEVQFRPVVGEAGEIVDDASGYFSTVGADVTASSHTSGYYGEGYHPIPPGEGNVYAQWNLFELQPGIPYQVDSRWTAAGNRSTSAQYRVRYAGDSGEQLIVGQTVDQTRNGGQWMPVAEFTPSDSAAAVELLSAPDGYVIADAVRLTPDAEAMSNVVTVPGTQQRVQLENELERGEWVFRVRAVDEQGIASEYSEPLSVSFP